MSEQNAPKFNNFINYFPQIFNLDFFGNLRTLTKHTNLPSNFIARSDLFYPFFRQEYDLDIKNFNFSLRNKHNSSDIINDGTITTSCNFRHGKRNRRRINIGLINKPSIKNRNITPVGFTGSISDRDWNIGSEINLGHEGESTKFTFDSILRVNQDYSFDRYVGAKISNDTTNGKILGSLFVSAISKKVNDEDKSKDNIFKRERSIIGVNLMQEGNDVHSYFFMNYAFPYYSKLGRLDTNLGSTISPTNKNIMLSLELRQHILDKGIAVVLFGNTFSSVNQHSGSVGCGVESEMLEFNDKKLKLCWYLMVDRFGFFNPLIGINLSL